MTIRHDQPFSPVTMIDSTKFAAFTHPSGKAVVIQFDPFYTDEEGVEHHTARLQIMLTMESAREISGILGRIASEVVVPDAVALPPGFKGHLPKMPQGSKNGRR